MEFNVLRAGERLPVESVRVDFAMQDAVFVNGAA